MSTDNTINLIATSRDLANLFINREMEKLGMQLEGVQRDGSLKWGKFEDIAVCAILEADWAQWSTTV